eukprot:TRINITY_DN6639_c0_g1_i12.p1 TRINITY_DN6639_c0_g1~~TRINITY_DN6639_c0_g1_i12.p1  ORF type:complete len:208 (-),score=21.39 TRINITY_DN6639_c0_g1_i12:160-783(-)
MCIRDRGIMEPRSISAFSRNSALAKLKHINLSYTLLDDELISGFRDSCKEFRPHYVMFMRTNVTAKGLQLFIESPAAAELKGLECGDDGSLIHKDILETVIKYSKSTKLEQLSIEGKSLDEEFVKAVQGLSMPSLIFLCHPWDDKLETKHYETLVTYMRTSFPNLRAVGISPNRFSDDELKLVLGKSAIKFAEIKDIKQVMFKDQTE